MNPQEAANEYLEIIRELDLSIRQRLTISVRDRWTYKHNQQLLKSIGFQIRKAGRQLEKLEKEIPISTLPADRIKALNNIYFNVFNFINRGERLTIGEVKSALYFADEIDRVASVKYLNGARHAFSEYMESYIDGILGKKLAEDKYERMIKNGTLFVQVSTTPTVCYICKPWLGKIGTIGHDVPGYPRLDNMFPIHWRCIHRIEPLLGRPDLSMVPESWMLTANRQEYYRRYMEDEENRKEWNRYKREYVKNYKTERVNFIYNQLFYGIK